MDLALALHRLWRKRLWLIPVALVASAVGLHIAFQMSYVPPAMTAKSSEFGTANTQFVVDSARSSLPNLTVPLTALSERAQVYAELLRTDPVRRRLGREAGVPWKSILVDGYTSSSGNPDAAPEPSATERASELADDQQNRRVFFRVLTGKPIVSISTQSTTAEDAAALANGAVTALAGYLDTLQKRQGFPASQQITLNQLGTAVGGTVHQSADKVLAGVAALVVFVMGCLLILLLSRLAEGLVALRGSAGDPAYPGAAPAPAALQLSEHPPADGHDPSGHLTDGRLRITPRAAHLGNGPSPTEGLPASTSQSSG